MALNARGRWLLGALAAVVVIVVGVVIAVNATGSSGSNSGANAVAGLKATLDKLPLPAGTVLVEEHAHPAQGDAPADIARQYRLPSAADPTSQLRAALTKAGYRPVNPQTGGEDSSVWTSATSATGGDVYVLPPGASGDGIELTWQGARLDVSLQPGQVR